MANTRKEFGQKIVEARTIKRLTQTELAERVGITQNNLSRIENGKYNPGLDILIKIANALELELDFI
jgi:transcriptional regulator with XRE-family HTH domain